MNAVKKISSLDTLEQVLERLEAAHAKLLEEAEHKRLAIIEGDLGRLEAIVEREKAVVAGIEKDEALRLATVRIARRALGLDERSGGKLSDLLAKAGEPYQTRLSAVRDKLKATLQTLHRKTRLNQELLKASLEHVAGFLRNIREAAGAQTVYTAKARKTQTGGRSLMDTSA